ncbi:hypothetical protein CY34DRAFT_767335 [Suillus luteus UH-Slu-Lm8-n1]|uniref:Uncharacterized protein n=1 Tax=Suillus luteus UH-Slu-Lm8-n1 TaxID=930992 RepID=A0A0C9ZQ03_9AGAM|nr:hypothetical protein CY34DRAFT_767335 [Suillus luteus UH-Slu-Lm8-n1]
MSLLANAALCHEYSSCPIMEKPPKLLLRLSLPNQAPNKSLISPASNGALNSFASTESVKAGKEALCSASAKPLIDSPSVRGGRNLDNALEVFIGMLDEIDTSNRVASERGHAAEGRVQEEEAERENRGPAGAEESESRSKRSRDGSLSEDDTPSSKRSKVVDTTKFPWSQRRSTTLASLPADIRETYRQLENFATDPKSVVTVARDVHNIQAKHCARQRE